MVGGELAAAGKAVSLVGGAAKQLASEDLPLKERLRDIAADSPAMAAAADAHAKRIAVREAMLLKLFAPLARLLGVSRDYFQTDFPKEMADKLQDIPEENLSPPSPSVAVPAMEGLSYSLEEPDLKAMYLNLLATATDGRRSTEAHPSFAQIIKQISAPEAQLLLATLERTQVPIVQVKLVWRDSQRFRVLQRHIAPIEGEFMSLPVWVDNWIRLGLVDVTYTEFSAQDGAYLWASIRPDVARLRDRYSDEVVRVVCDRGLVRRTDFGQRFAAAVS